MLICNHCGKEINEGSYEKCAICGKTIHPDCEQCPKHVLQFCFEVHPRPNKRQKVEKEKNEAEDPMGLEPHQLHNTYRCAICGKRKFETGEWYYCPHCSPPLEKDKGVLPVCPSCVEKLAEAGEPVLCPGLVNVGVSIGSSLPSARGASRYLYLYKREDNETEDAMVIESDLKGWDTNETKENECDRINEEKIAEIPSCQTIKEHHIIHAPPLPPIGLAAQNPSRYASMLVNWILYDEEDYGAAEKATGRSTRRRVTKCVMVVKPISRTHPRIVLTYHGGDGGLPHKLIGYADYVVHAAGEIPEKTFTWGEESWKLVDGPGELEESDRPVVILVTEHAADFDSDGGENGWCLYTYRSTFMCHAEIRGLRSLRLPVLRGLLGYDCYHTEVMTQLSVTAIGLTIGCCAYCHNWLKALGHLGVVSKPNRRQTWYTQWKYIMRKQGIWRWVELADPKEPRSAHRIVELCKHGGGSDDVYSLEDIKIRQISQDNTGEKQERLRKSELRYRAKKKENKYQQAKSIIKARIEGTLAYSYAGGILGHTDAEQGNQIVTKDGKTRSIGESGREGNNCLFDSIFKLLDENKKSANIGNKEFTIGGPADLRKLAVKAHRHYKKERETNSGSYAVTDAHIQDLEKSAMATLDEVLVLSRALGVRFQVYHGWEDGSVSLELDTEGGHGEPVRIFHSGVHFQPIHQVHRMEVDESITSTKGVKRKHD